jgi:hypothetical protein
MRGRPSVGVGAQGGGTVLRLLHTELAAYPGIGESNRVGPRILDSILVLLQRNATAEVRNAS